ncbi:hypothetical protein [Nocardia salmonicida]|uniref:hypothetical protein n=1 Tax=Nocardia salmonicida TaxID=53431 RepID=UPI0033C74709
MTTEQSDRADEISHLINLGENVITFITSSIEILNRTYFAFHVSQSAEHFFSATSRLLGAVDGAHPEFMSLAGQVKTQADVLIKNIEEKPSWLDVPEGGFSLLHATQLIGIWGALECFVGDVFKASLKFRPELLDGKPFEKISLPVSLVAKGSDELYSTVYQKVLPPGSGQIGKLEDVLNMVELGGPIDSELKRKLLSAHQIRNVWAHNSGVVDAHFMALCPYLGYKIGDIVNMTAAQYQSFAQAVIDYISLILARINDRGFGQ